MIEFATGNFFDYNADIMINTVNCVGVMGAGVALQFKKQYPDMNTEYVKLCRKGLIQPGKPHVWSNAGLFSDEKQITIINFPTKNDWKKPSEYEYIELGLKWLKEYLSDKPTSTITIPALGCGHGGLDWETVKKLIIKYLSDIETRILVFEPTSSITKETSPTYEELNIFKSKGIVHVKPIDPNYPAILKGKTAMDLYVKGNLELLNSKTISIIVNNKAEEREIKALLDCINQLSDRYVYIVGLGASVEANFLKELLIRKLKVIVIISVGILQLNLRKDLKELWDNELITTISLLPPNQSWTSYANASTIRFRISVGKSLLINTVNFDTIKPYVKNIKNCDNVFLIKYWSEIISDFDQIKATLIGRKRSSGMPNLDCLEKALNF